MKASSLVMFIGFLFSFSTIAQVTPLPVDQDTVVLWNFNSDPSISIVEDLGPHQISGTAVNSGLAQPNQVLLQARSFFTQASHINFGTLSPTHPLNLEGDEWTVEFAILPLSPAHGARNIYENGRLSIEIRDNKIAVYILRNSIWQGISTTRTLSQGVYSRVAVIFNDDESELGIKVNNQTWAAFKLEPEKKKTKKLKDFNAPILVGGSPRETIAELTMGRSHGCLSTNGPDVMCWGANESGQIGDGTFTNSNLPVVVEGLKSASALSAGLSSSCALSEGKTFCWGSNLHSALGVSGILLSRFPVEVANVTSAEAIDSGDYHSCSIMEDRTVKCWGLNQTGQLGLGFVSENALPTLLPGLSDIKQISLGKNHSCAVDYSGNGYCWGLNNRGQVGQTPTNAIIPVPQLVSGVVCT